MADLPEIKILLVEDSPTDARLLQQGLKEVQGAPFAVTWVERLADAITKLGQQTFDVGLLDLTLPDSSGPATFTRVLEAFPGLPIIVLTGASDETAGNDAIRRGVQDYLVKGTADGKAVARAIRYAIERKQANTALLHLNTELEQRVNEIQVVNKALQESRTAALNLMDDAVEARRLVEQNTAKLKESREDLNRAQAVANTGSWRMDIRKNELLWSDENYRIFGVPVGTHLTFETFLSMVHPDDRNYVDLHWKAFLTGGPYDLEHRIIVDGQIKWLYEKAEMESNGSGEVLGGFGTTQDITDRKKGEDELNQLNRTLKALSASSQALSRAGDEKEYLREICRIVQEDCGHAMVWIGFAKDDEEKSILPAAYAGFEEAYLDTLILTWADTERGRGPTGAAIRTGKNAECKDMLTDPAFAPWRAEAVKRGYASSIALPLFTLARDRAFGAITIYGRKPGAFSSDEAALLSELASDLAFGIQTIRLHAAHTRAEEAVRESEARYRSLFNGMTEGFALHEIICDNNGEPCDYKYLDVNKAFERLTGLARADVVEKTYSAVPKVLGEDPKRVAIYGRVALTGEPVHFETYSSALKTYFEVYSYRPAPLQFATILTNVTEQVESRIKIEELNTFLKRRAAELSSSYSELQTLTQLLSHDLRVPLRVVSGYSHLLLNEYRDKIDTSGNNYITLLDKGVQQVNTLLDDVLVLSDISRKQMWLQRVNLSLLAGEVAEDLRKSQPERKTEIIIQDNVLEWADQGFMKQVLKNLFENAWKFTFPRERPRIEFGTLNGQTPQVCFIRDNGTGFDSQDAQKLFTPFRRLSDDNDFVTAGVGLAIVERIIQRHGGKVWAEGEKDKGAVFYFKLG
jgi:signal transduction histidine kinase/DNA-binding response OmpR family regulator/putative methionine-R-sulfoxide reductase with GAF domain